MNTNPSSRCIIVATGGTAGHIFPALGVAHAFRNDPCRLFFVTDRRGMIHFRNHDNVIVSPVRNLFSGSLMSRIFSIPLLLAAMVHALTVIVRLRPDALIGFGGHPALPICLVGALLGIPLIIHEQNRVLGRANRILAPISSKILVSFPDTKRIPNSDKVSVSGNPLRSSFSGLMNVSSNNYKAKKNDRTSKGKSIILVTGGSLGARFLSDLVPGALGRLTPDHFADVHIVHQTPGADCARVQLAYKRLGVSARVAAFLEDMDKELAACHVYIGRSGGSTIAELMAVGRPSILIPMPTALDRQQFLNASYLQEKQAAYCLNQDRNAQKHLAALIAEFIRDPETWKQMGKRAAALAVHDASDQVRRHVLALMGKIAN